jgi:hypothetical protein
VFVARSRHGIDSKTDQAARYDIARGCHDAGADDLSCYGDLLRDKSVFLEGRDKFFILLTVSVQGVTQPRPLLVWTSAPLGVELNPTSSVVPRTTVAHPPHKAARAKASTMRIAPSSS